MATVALQSTITQGTTGLFVLDGGTALDDTQLATTDPGLFYVDQDSGQVYTREAIPGDDAEDGNWTAQGKLLPFVGDQAAPNAPTGLSVTPVTTQNDEGTTLPGFEVEWNTSSEDDIIGYHLEVDAQTFDDATGIWTAATFATPLSRNYGVFDAPPKEGPYLVRAEFIGGTPYDFRLAALDAEGFSSAWSSPVVTGTAAKDGTAPEVPTNPQGTPGYRLVGLKWDKNEEPDLWFYQVRFWLTATQTSDDAEYIRTNSSFIIVKDLTPSVEYTFEVRAVDRSSNVATSESDLTGLDFNENKESGWSAQATATPSLIGASDVAFNSVLTSILSSNEIDADDIKTGTLKVGGSANPGSLTVYDSAARTIATLNEDGYVMVNANNDSEAVWLTAGSIYFTDEYTGNVDTTTWTTGMTPDGINASAITFGAVGGGANAVPNAGFELAPFSAPTTSVYTDSTDWSTATSTVNMNVSTTHLTMTGT